MEFEELQNLDFTKSEILVYTTLLKIGQSSTGNIVKQAKISSGKIYEILNKLIEKGLASYVVKNNVKHFSASEPSKIKEYLEKEKKDFEEKTKSIEKLLPQLEQIGKGKKPEYHVQVYEGFEGFKTSFTNLLDSLEKGGEYFSVGIGMTHRTKAMLLFYEKIEKIFQTKKIKKKFILTDISKDNLNFTKKFKGEIKKLPGFHLAPFAVTENFTIIYNFKELSVIVIKNKTIAEQFKFLFESLWKIAKK